MKIATKLHSINKSIFKTPDIITAESSIDFPLLFLGFQHFLHQSEGKLIVKNEFEGKKKVYTVINPYNLEIDDYPDDINSLATKYFKKARSVVFLEIWELLNDYKMSPSSFNAPKEFHDAVKYMYPKATENTKNADLLIVTEEPPSTTPLYLYEQTMLPFYLKTVNELNNMLKKDGSFIMRITESFTKTTAKLLALLTTLFKEVHLVKPAISDPSTSAKYVVCISFVGASPGFVKIPDSRILDIYSEVDIFTEIDPFITNLRKINIELLNEQFIYMNRIVTFIQAQNYRGDVYDKSRQDQIAAAKEWIAKYLV